jgi:hypothetical protein
MTPAELDNLYRPLAKRLHEGHMRWLGIEDTMVLAETYNRSKFSRQEEWRRSLYENELNSLLSENGPFTRRPLEMQDGWALDTSLSLPHLDRILEDADEIIAERRGVRTTGTGAYRSYFQDVWTAEDCRKYPSFLDFATSSDVLATVCQYLGTIPALTTTLPAGIRLVESNAEFDDRPEIAKDSQLYHIDYYSRPNVYLLVLLADATFESGPWTFVPKTRSQVAKQELGYWQRGKGYRVSDEQIYSVIDQSEVIEFAYPRGTVLFIESSGCFHFGSRNSVQPRFQLMYGYSGVIRTDFSEVFMEPKTYPVRETASLLRKLVLEKNMLP